MSGGAAREGSESLVGNGCGRALGQSRNAGSGMNWTLLLSRSHGGPGEPPGRAEAIVRAEARSAEKALVKGRKSRRGG